MNLVKIKRSPKNLELHINVAKKTSNSTFFHGKQQIPQQTANSMAQHKNPLLIHTAGPVDHKQPLYIIA